jgi:hypothetical protein
MTPNILKWLQTKVAPLVNSDTRLVEIGSLNVNGTPRSVLPTKNYTGVDRVPGRGVDLVAQAEPFLLAHTWKYDMVVACECYEHDPRWWLTDAAAKSALDYGGLYVVTAPAIGFPFHDYGGDYYRFTEMAFEEVMFKGYTIIDLQTIPGEKPGENTVVGVAKKP